MMLSQLFFNLVFMVTLILTKDTELKLVQILFRHGIRSPVHVYPIETAYTNEYWAKFGGLGQLLPEGMKQLYDYGKFIRNDYNDFLTFNYNPEMVYIRSTDYDRTLMSAYSLLAGLYPPASYQIWNNDILWQPIPVHTVDNKLDPILHEKASCPRFDYLLQKVLTSKKHLEKQKNHSAFLAKMSNYSKVQNLDLFSMWKIADSVVIKNELNLPQFQWAIDNYAKIVELFDYVFYCDFYNVEMAKLNAGGVLNEIVENMHKKLKKSKNEIYLFSAHDTYVAAMYRLFGFDEFVGSQSFAAAITFELHKSLANETHYVKIFRKNNKYNETITKIPLKIEGCSDVLCPFNEFLDSVSDKRISDFTIPCMQNEAVKPTSKLSLHLLVYFNLSIFLYL